MLAPYFYDDRAEHRKRFSTRNHESTAKRRLTRNLYESFKIKTKTLFRVIFNENFRLLYERKVERYHKPTHKANCPQYSLGGLSEFSYPKTISSLDVS